MIRIKDFEIGKQTDCELERLLSFLKLMSHMKDVRDVNVYMNDFYMEKEIPYIDVNGM